MGWTVLYVAFGFVALWLLGEVLLQYKARLRWRLLAFGGFLAVVAGVVVHSVLVIGAGSVAFAVGQTFVTLSFRRGFAKGWAVGSKRDQEAEPAGKSTAGRRRREGAAKSGRDRTESAPRPEPAHDPEPEAPEPVTPQGAYDPAAAAEYGDEYPNTPAQGVPSLFGHGGEHAYTGPTESTAYTPQPMPDETSAYGVYGTDAGSLAAHHSDPSAGYRYHDPQQPASGYPGQGEQPTHHTTDPYATGAYPGGHDHTAYDHTAYDHTAYDPTAYDPTAYGHGAEAAPSYPAYSDPYIGTTGTDGYGYDYGTDYASGQHQYAAADPYAQYSMDTPPGGVWVPQQRDTQYPDDTDQEQQAASYPQEPQAYPYQGTGEYQQYRS
ncbi:hypothetical protein [Streptomyces sp. NPDC006879]|uniref:hypothetical protein n=1 Tax=Streptomyces sp. NPDC006879 TaxID=3364767 RepID=UPI0036ACBB89